MGEGGVKNPEELPALFMNGPIITSHYIEYLFSKPSGNLICKCFKFLFAELETANFSYWHFIRVPLYISLTSSNNQFSEFRILNIYNEILFTCLINSRARHCAIYILKSGNLFSFFLNLKEASKCVLRIIKKKS